MLDQYNQQNNKGIRIFDGQICAGYAEGRTDGCQVNTTCLITCFIYRQSYLITFQEKYDFHFKRFLIVFNVHLKELNLLLVGKTSHLGVVLSEQDGSDSPSN